MWSTVFVLQGTALGVSAGLGGLLTRFSPTTARRALGHLQLGVGIVAVLLPASVVGLALIDTPPDAGSVTTWLVPGVELPAAYGMVAWLIAVAWSGLVAALVSVLCNRQWLQRWAASSVWVAALAVGTLASVAAVWLFSSAS